MSFFLLASLPVALSGVVSPSLYVFLLPNNRLLLSVLPYSLCFGFCTSSTSLFAKLFSDVSVSEQLCTPFSGEIL